MIKRRISRYYLMISIATLWSCTGTQESLPYTEQIRRHRQEIDRFMNEDQDSPFASADSVVRLKYYPVREEFKVIANIEKIQSEQELSLATSKGDNRTFLSYAYLNFQLNDVKQRFLVLKSTEGNGLFLAFADQTSDETTYGGGRYINLAFSDQAEKITLDFNLAYNPYCAYNAEYSCPIPPVENYLRVPVEAGEKIYK